MPSYRNHDMGDLIVHLTVKFPDHLDPESLAPLESILPPRPEQPTFPENIHLDEHVEMVDAGDRKTRSMDPDAMDEDDEQGGGPQVQCAKYVITKLQECPAIDLLTLLPFCSANNDLFGLDTLALFPGRQLFPSSYL